MIFTKLGMEKSSSGATVCYDELKDIGNEAVHPQSSWVMSLGRLCKQKEGNLHKGKEEERRHHIS